ncbi:MAG: hypothetical protein ACK50A_10200 [Sphingobacteriaceae bacterium]|jgi:hypothetical protein
MRYILFALIFLGNILNAQSPYKNGNSLINAMYQKYENKWYKNFSFSQTMEFYRNDSIIKKDVWHEIASLPGNLLIKFGEKDSKDGVLFSNFMVYSFQKDKEMHSSPMVHDLLLVGLDVYFYKPEFTCHLLDSLGYDLSKIREDVFEGRKVYVAGAEKNDLESNQFWIDAERLYMHKIIYKKKGKVSEVVFADYEKMKNYWGSKTIIFKQNGKLNLIERYYDIKFPKNTNINYFNPIMFDKTTLE